jgi:hypothetical protein
MSAATLGDRLSSLRSALGWIFVLSTVLLVLCKLWLDYYEGRPLPIGPGDRDLTLVVFQTCAVLSVSSLAGFLLAMAINILTTGGQPGRDSQR